MNNTDPIDFNNAEEAEQAQMLSLQSNMDAVAKHRAAMAKKAEQPSLESCEDCGEEIPKARRLAVKGVTKCIYCQQLSERRV